MRLCPQCSRENPDEARFCSACGTALVAPEPTREERKVVTVLFADLVGFTSRAEQMDPEDVRALLSPYYAHLRSELERYGGTVEKFIGDAVMALFGAPVAHEDDPERAVRVALRIRDWIREQPDELQLRIAITTGEALIALGARPSEGEGMASGDVVNTAARLQSAAPVDGILVDETTYRATSKVIEYRAFEPVAAKGKAEPVPAWEAVEARSRFGIDTTQALRAPLIGRERELELLTGALARARAESAPQLVTLVGVPGIGKSRLVYELFDAVEQDAEIIYWRQGRCLPYGEGVSLWALGEIVKAHAGILENDSPDAVLAKLERAISDLLEDRDAEWVVRHLGLLVGIEGEPRLDADRRTEAFAAWRRFFEAIADTGPLVLVFEDLHWADEGLLDFVDHLVDWAGSVPILVVCTARPELLTRRSDWGGGKTNAVTLSLSPLDDEETARLLAALLDRAVLPAETQSLLLQRSGGNPLYAEEFVRMVSDRGLLGGDGELPMPETVQGIVAARLDALPADEKGLLQDAAVIGKVFWLGAAAGIGRLERTAAEEALHRLERKEFVRRERRSSVGEELEYAFRHLLVRDVAYGQIPRAQRVEKHRLAAEWIEGLGRPEEQAEMLAHHYLTALELARAAGAETGQLAERARPALREAGDRAFSISGYPAARQFYRTALDVLPEDAPDRPHVLFRYAVTVNRTEFASALDLLEEARDALLEVGDFETAVEAELELADQVWSRGERDRVFEIVERARARVAERPASFAKARVLGGLSRYQMLATRHDTAIRLGREALAMVDELGGDEELRASVLNNIGSSRIGEGDFDGIADLEQSVDVAVAINSVESIRAYGNLAHTLLVLGQLQRREEMLAKAVAETRRFGIDDYAHWVAAEQMWTLYWRGRWSEGLDRLDELIGNFEQSRFWMETTCRWLRGRIRLAQGDNPGAAADAERGVERARSSKDPQVLWPTLAFAARAFIATDTARARALVEEVLSDWRENLAVSAASEAVNDMAVALRTLGEQGALSGVVPDTPEIPWFGAGLAFDAGDFQEAAERYERIGARPEEAYARLRAAESLVHAGRRSEADEELQRALDFSRSVGATAYIREGEALLAASA
jgi:class 3 adenylate cyclase/tetratricopeptide (TPR) repeat protein